MKVCLALLVALFVSASAAAQTIDYWELRLYLRDAPGPISPVPTRLLRADVVCGQLAPVGPSGAPTKVSWTDPADPTRFCQWTDPGTGLQAQPFAAGDYDATVTAVAGPLTSLESARSPFTIVVPATPTQVTVGR